MQLIRVSITLPEPNPDHIATLATLARATCCGPVESDDHSITARWSGDCRGNSSAQDWIECAAGLVLPGQLWVTTAREEGEWL